MFPPIKLGSSTMRRVLLLASAAACLVVSPAFPADNTPTALPAPMPTDAASTPLTPAEAQAAIDAARVERAQRVELNARMNAVIEASQKAVAGLQKVIEATTDASVRRDLELRVMQVKRGTTLDLMRVQATFARETGRIAQAEKIEADLAEILNPKRATPGAGAQVRTGVVAPAGGAR
jgi:hypothetical protein